jgi:hypothetical protein
LNENEGLSMAKSLQEQLLQAGLIDNKKLKQATKEKKKQVKQQHRGAAQTNESEEWAKQAREAKLEKDRELSRLANEEAQKKAIASQIVQLIESHKIDRSRGEIGYQFTDGSKIKKIYVTEVIQGQLANGRCAIARLGSSYEVIPTATAQKIQERDEGSIVLLNTMQTKTDDDDPYAGYEIPDDLMW